MLTADEKISRIEAIMRTHVEACGLVEAGRPKGDPVVDTCLYGQCRITITEIDRVIKS